MKPAKEWRDKSRSLSQTNRTKPIYPARPYYKHRNICGKFVLSFSFFVNPLLGWSHFYTNNKIE